MGMITRACEPVYERVPPSRTALMQISFAGSTSLLRCCSSALRPGAGSPSMGLWLSASSRSRRAARAATSGERFVVRMAVLLRKSQSAINNALKAMPCRSNIKLHGQRGQSDG